MDVRGAVGLSRNPGSFMTVDPRQFGSVDRLMRPRLPRLLANKQPPFRVPKSISTLSFSATLEFEQGFVPTMMLGEAFCFVLPLQTHGNCHASAGWKHLKRHLNLPSEDGSPRVGATLSLSWNKLAGTFAVLLSSHCSCFSITVRRLAD